MITASFISGFNGGTIVMIVLALLIAIYLIHLDKKQKSDPIAALCKQYQKLSPAVLAALPDEEVVRVAVAHILSRTDRYHPDVYHLIPSLSHGQTAVYSVWLTVNELAASDMEAWLKSPSARFSEMAIDGFSLIGADTCAATLTAVLEDPSNTAEAFLQALEAEAPLTLCTAYIRENPQEFCNS